MAKSQSGHRGHRVAVQTPIPRSGSSSVGTLNGTPTPSARSRSSRSRTAPYSRPPSVSSPAAPSRRSASSQSSTLGRPAPRTSTTHRASSRSSSRPASLPTLPSSREGTPNTVISCHHPSFDDVHEDEDSDILNEIIMAINMHNDETVGCAYYVAIDEILYLQEDIPMAGIDLIETLLVYAQPTTVIVSHRAPDRLIQYLERGAQDIEGRSESADLQGLHSAYVLRTATNAEFSYDGGRERLVGLDLDLFGNPQRLFVTAADPDMNGDGGSMRTKMMRLGSLVNLDSKFSIGCAGAVLNDLNRRKAAAYFPGDPNADMRFRVRSVEMFTLSNSMFVNADTLASLQILRSENHPNSQMQGPSKSQSGSKESLSVYGLVQGSACTPQGRMTLRKMFLRPSVDLDLIRERQKTIQVLLHPENISLLQTIVKLLRKIKNVKRPVILLQKGVDMPSRRKSVQSGVWMALFRFVKYGIELRENVRGLVGGEKLEITSKLRNDVDPLQIVRVGELISQVIDFDESKTNRRTVVLPGVNAELDELKRQYHGLGSFLSEVASNLARSVPEWACQYIHTCQFYPQLGFLVAVHLDPETGKGLYDGEGLAGDKWETMFVNESLIYYKNNMMRDLDEQFGDLYCKIVDKEIDIIHELTVKVLESEETLVTASDLFGDFDSLTALALSAEKYHWVAPQMTSANAIHVQGGRHPLQELVVPSFIKNDTDILGGRGSQASDVDLIEGGPSMLILTGPNHSGKSIYLKQVALIVFLAHIGSFVPADSATIGVTDRILTRIATRESVSRNESAFAIDLKQMIFAMNFATQRSLVLIDEFGKGTNPNNGAGLAGAVFDHFLKLGDERPKVLAATHFHEIFEAGFVNEDDYEGRVSFGHMEVHVNLEAGQADQQVSYLFQLVPGRSTSSFGTTCAAMNGVPPAVVERAETLTLLQARGESLQAACAKLTLEEEKDLEQAEAAARRFLAWDIPPVNRGTVKRLRSNIGRAGATPANPQGARDEDLTIRNVLRDILSPGSGSGSSSSLGVVQT